MVQRNTYFSSNYTAQDSKEELSVRGKWLSLSVWGGGERPGSQWSGLSVVAHTFSLGAQEAEAGQPGLHAECPARQNSTVKVCLKEN